MQVKTKDGWKDLTPDPKKVTVPEQAPSVTSNVTRQKERDLDIRRALTALEEVQARTMDPKRFELGTELPAYALKKVTVEVKP